MDRCETHGEQIERWARFVKENPTKWKSKIRPFLDGQILMSRRFYKRLAETPNGLGKIKELGLSRYGNSNS